MRGICSAVALVAALLLVGGNAAGAPATHRRAGGAHGSTVFDYSSVHFLIHTDLPAKDAHELLRQLEMELKLIAAYWGRPPSGIVECYVANDFTTWPPELVGEMDHDGVAKIREGAGVCIARVMSSGNRFISKCHLYAVARDNQGGQVPLHEAVHGYCQQTFGRTGPRWYAEGMAEMGHYWINNSKGVNAPKVVIDYLSKSKLRRLNSLIVTDKSTGGTWQDYCWWWMLCHLLENNPNYTREFRVLGIEMLTGKNLGFEQVFGPKIKQLNCEYELFHKHLEAGYRVDLCALDWNRKFFGLTTTGRTVSAPIQANRGWQPSGAIVAAGAEYTYSAAGTWRIHGIAEPVDAQGTDDGTGRLVGAVMKDFKLGKEFELGQSDTFIAPADGNLYLRLRIPWNKLANNSGHVTVKLRIKAAKAAAKP